jgi:hypothetical protein
MTEPSTGPERHPRLVKVSILGFLIQLRRVLIGSERDVQMHSCGPSEERDNMKMEGSSGSKGYSKLKHVFTASGMIILIWLGLAAGVMLAARGKPEGFLYVGIGLTLLILPLTSPFKKYWKRREDWGGYPVLVFTGNIVMLLMYATLTAVFAGDPFVLYNQDNKLSLILWGVASLLALGALVANIIAYRLDRKAMRAEGP